MSISCERGPPSYVRTGMRVCLALLLVPALAHAEVIEFDEPTPLDEPKPIASRDAMGSIEEPKPTEALPPSPRPEVLDAQHWRLEGGIGVRVGSARLDSRDVSTVVPGYIAGGFRRDRLLLYGEYQLSGVSFPAQSGANVAIGGSLAH